MATYLELHTLRGADAITNLKQKITVALAIEANIIAKLPTPTTEQKTFAVTALGNPEHYLPTVLNYILAEYNAATTTVITNATDAQVQAAVTAAVDTLLGI